MSSSLQTTSSVMLKKWRHDIGWCCHVTPLLTFCTLHEVLLFVSWINYIQFLDNDIELFIRATFGNDSHIHRVERLLSCKNSNILFYHLIIFLCHSFWKYEYDLPNVFFSYPTLGFALDVRSIAKPLRSWIFGDCRKFWSSTWRGSHTAGL